jgi:hypothetical protein
VLSARLDQLDQDTRTLTDVVDRSAGSKEPAVERRIWASAFQALAVVVPQYRTISLFSADGTLDVQAVDPTESAATVQALHPFNRSLAAQVSRTRDRALGKPAARLGERAFLLYGLPVRNGGRHRGGQRRGHLPDRDHLDAAAHRAPVRHRPGRHHLVGVRDRRRLPGRHRRSLCTTTCAPPAPTSRCASTCAPSARG